MGGGGKGCTTLKMSSGAETEAKIWGGGQGIVPGQREGLDEAGEQ